MTSFLTATRIRQSIVRLSTTRLKASVLDFLIVKRTLVLKNAQSAAIVTTEPAYVQAASECAAVWGIGKVDMDGQKQIFNIFAAAEETRLGYRNGKYLSNGTGTTIAANKWRKVIDLTGVNPRRASLAEGHDTALADLLLKADGDASPSLTEFAVWLFRAEDVGPLLAGVDDPTERSVRLAAEVSKRFALTDSELAVLFPGPASEISHEDLQGTIAAPPSYLPALSAPPIAANLGCSLELVAALCAKPFVIVSGASGTGKTRAALKLAEALQRLYDEQVDGQIFQLVTVGPDWTSPRKLLGYRSPFGQLRALADGTQTNDTYEITETLRVILRACHPNSTKVPHFLIFDEMNLSHVERYFAPFLSLMEASAILDDTEHAPIVDRSSLQIISVLLDLEDSSSAEAESARLLVENNQPLELPANLFYVGTVNIDETTSMFSPKVLDRAHVLEVRALSPSAYVRGEMADRSIDLAVANELLREAIDDREGAAPASSDPTVCLQLLVAKYGVSAESLAAATSFALRVLDGCFSLATPIGFEFAYRVDSEVFRYLRVWIRARIAMGASSEVAMEGWTEGLDLALFQKVFTKFHGSRASLGDSLKAFDAFLGGSHSKSVPPAQYSLGADAVFGIAAADAITFPTAARFDKCRAKLRDMQSRLVARGFVSFLK